MPQLAHYAEGLCRKIPSPYAPKSIGWMRYPRANKDVPILTASTSLKASSTSHSLTYLCLRFASLSGYLPLRLWMPCLHDSVSLEYETAGVVHSASPPFCSLPLRSAKLPGPSIAPLPRKSDLRVLPASEAAQFAGGAQFRPLPACDQPSRRRGLLPLW